MKRYQLISKNTETVLFESDDYMECSIKMEEWEKKGGLHYDGVFEIVDMDKNHQIYLVCLM